MGSVYENLVRRQPREPSRKEHRVQQRLETKIASICEMYKDGASLRRIAAVHRTSHETIRQILNNHGILTKYRYKQKELTIGDKKVCGAYVHVYVGIGYSGATRTGWMLEHRLVMQKQLQRPLMPWEIVHHRDRNKANNALANLEVTTITQHATCLRCPYYEFYVQHTGRKYILLEDLTIISNS